MNIATMSVARAVSQILCKFVPPAVELRANWQFTHNTAYYP